MVPKQSRLTALLSPPTVAVHNNGNMIWANFFHFGHMRPFKAYRLNLHYFFLFRFKCLVDYFNVFIG